MGTRARALQAPLSGTSVALIGAALALVVAPDVVAQQLPFIHYSPRSELNPLPSAEVNGVYPDREGFLWAVVYSSGLVRYDGVEMELFDESDGLPDVAQWEVVEDAAGRLWVASNGGLAVTEEALSVYGGTERPRFTTRLGEVPLLDVSLDRNQMAPDAQGRMWVGTDGLGVVRYVPAPGGVRADTIRLAGAGEDPPAVRAILHRRDGSVWAALADGRLIAAEGGRLPFRRMATLGSGDEAPTVLYESSDGRLWAGTRDGAVWRVDGPDALARVAEPLGSAVVALIEGPGDRLLVATGADGLVDVSPSSDDTRAYSRVNGLLGDGLHDLARDAEGNLWIAQTGGLSKLRTGWRAFIGYTTDSFVGERPLLPAAAVGTVAPVRVGPCDIWVGTAEGVGCIEEGFPARADAVDGEDGLASVYVNALAGGDDRVWIGTIRGIFALSQGAAPSGALSVRRIQVNGAPFLLSAHGGSSILGAERFTLPLADGAAVEGVWFAAYRRLFGFVDGRWVTVDASSGLPPSVFHAVAADATGRLWAGSRDAGLYRTRRPLTSADLDRLARLPSRDDPAPGVSADTTLFERVWGTESGALTDQIEALRLVGDEMWVATPEGLSVLSAGEGPVRTLGHIDEDGGLPSKRVYSLALSPDAQSLWVGTNGGLTEIDIAERTVRRSFDRTDGLVGNEVWFYGSVRFGPEGRVYFGTADGLSVVDPALVERPAAPPRLHLREARVERRASGYSEVLFRYAATSFVDERAVRYRYRLLGYDEEWSEPTAEANVRYTNLPAFVVPREYTLQVLAGTEGGPWTESPLSQTVRVRPPWWFGPWAVAGYVMLLGLGVFGIDRIQRRRVLARERERTRLREARLEAEAARAEQAASDARAQALTAEAERQAVELSKARELAEAYDQLEEAHEELVGTQAQLVQQEKMASLGRLTAGVAHELKNPLNFVTNFARLNAELADELAEVLEEGSGGNAVEVEELIGDLRRNAVSIESHGRRADEIVRHMLLHSRGSAGPRRALVLDDVVEDSIGLAGRGQLATDPTAKVAVELVLGAGRTRISGAPLELGRVLVNLFDNAYDAVLEGTAAGATPTVRVLTDITEGHAFVHVEDNGPGIKDQVRDKIFEPFFTTKPTGEGTGLGLSLSFDVVQQHGGELSVADRPGGGTVFTVKLPTLPTPDASGESTPDGDAQSALEARPVGGG